MSLQVVPESYRSRLLQLIEKAKQHLHDGERLPQVFFIGSTEESVLQTINVDTSSDLAKEESATNARRVATFLDADFVVLMSEAWALPANKLKDAQAILDRYGSIGAYPGRLDVAAFQLETRHGYFSGTAPILAAPPSKKRRKLGEVVWLRGDSAYGMLAGILPKLPVQA